MLRITASNSFKKDLKLAMRRGLDISLLDEIVTTLANEEPLPEKCRDHNLIGEYAGFRECHIQPDWLLIYRVEQSDLLLFLTRTGTHADLFK